jgi:hypothetical protein
MQGNILETIPLQRRVRNDRHALDPEKSSMAVPEPVSRRGETARGGGFLVKSRIVGQSKIISASASERDCSFRNTSEREKREIHRQNHPRRLLTAEIGGKREGYGLRKESELGMGGSNARPFMPSGFLSSARQ